MFQPKDLLGRLGRFPARRLLVAYSGGLDSSVLLHALHGLQDRLPGRNLAAVHIHHGLHLQADQWQAHCEAVCRGLRVPLITLPITVAGGGGLEAAARRSRYAALGAHLRPGDLLLTAQHADDQAETLLLQMLRGAGPRGLSAMAPRQPLGQGWMMRPLLSVGRGDLEAYARRQGLGWVEDPSNQQARFDRNYLRYQVLPEIHRRWPAMRRTLGRVATHCAEAQWLLEERAREDLQAIGESDHLPVGALRHLGPARQRNLLRYWITEKGLPLPATVHLERILREVLTARSDRTPLVAWEGGEVRRFRDRLYRMAPCPPIPAGWSRDWDGRGALQLPAGLGRLVAAPLLAPMAFAVTFRRGGERCHPAGRGGSHPLKKLFQEWGVPPWRRSRIPLVFLDGRLVAVVGHCSDQALPDLAGRLEWRHAAE